MEACQGQLFAGNISVPARCKKFFPSPLQLMTLHCCVVGRGPALSHPGWQWDAQSRHSLRRCPGLVGPGQRRGASPGRFPYYVPRACPLNPARERRGAGERQRSRAERCHPRRDGLGGSLRSLHAARPALRTRHLQNHPLRLHPAGDREYASLRCLKGPTPG